MVQKRILVEVKHCKRCKEEMSANFSSELNIKNVRHLASDYCWDCGLIIERNAQARRWKFIKGARVLSVKCDNIGIKSLMLKARKRKFLLRASYDKLDITVVHHCGKKMR